MARATRRLVAYVRTPLVEKQIAAQAASHGIGLDEVVERIMLAH
jgi:3-hydroxybutyrate dehydrogenase